MAEDPTSLGPYTLVEQIGQGGFASVWLAADEEGNNVAVKRFAADHGRDVDREKAKNERACLERMDHPNVLALLDAVEDEGVDALVLEYCEAGDLIHKMKRVTQGGAENEAQAWQVWSQVIAGIGHMHEMGVAHLDLKPQNILLASGDDDEVLRVKLCDFSHSFISTTAGAKVPASQVGAGKYMAPEVSSGDPYDGPAADVWSCGVILYTLLTGALPFENADKILAAEWRQVDWFSAPLNEVFSKIFQPVTSRWSLADVHASPWVTAQKGSDAAAAGSPPPAAPQPAAAADQPSQPNEAARPVSVASSDQMSYQAYDDGQSNATGTEGGAAPEVPAAPLVPAQFSRQNSDGSRRPGTTETEEDKMSYQAYGDESDVEGEPGEGEGLPPGGEMLEPPLGYLRSVPEDATMTMRSNEFAQGERRHHRHSCPPTATRKRPHDPPPMRACVHACILRVGRISSHRRPALQPHLLACHRRGRRLLHGRGAGGGSAYPGGAARRR